MSKFLGVVVAAAEEAAAAGEAAAGVAQVLHLAGCRVDTKHKKIGECMVESSFPLKYVHRNMVMTRKKIS